MKTSLEAAWRDKNGADTFVPHHLLQAPQAYMSTYMCVLSIYVSSYDYICVLIPLYI